MTQVNMLQAKTNLSKLVGMLLNGEEDVIYIARNGEAVAQLTRIEPKPRKKIGVAKGKITIPDDFDAWDSEVENMFSGEI